MRKFLALPALGLLLAVSGCKTVSSAANGVASASQSVAHAATSAVPSLVNVNLSNVLNNLALDLHINKANIPINAQIPISVAANVCGISINILSIGAGGGSSKGCTAQTTSPQLDQAVQQQLAANGSVGGGAQSNSGTSAGSSSATPTQQSAPQQTTPQQTVPQQTVPQQTVPQATATTPQI